MHRPLPAIVLALAVAAAWPAHAQDAGAQLAADKGCYNCHGEPARRNVPSFAALAADYARYRGMDARTESQLVERLHHGSLFSHIAAHERLGDDEARTLIRWIVSGAP